MRYTPEEADEDLMLYHSNLTEFSQIRYIEHESFLEDRFPVCGEGMIENPGSCESFNTYEGDRDVNTTTGCGGCSAGGMEGVLGVWFMGTLAALRRRE